MSGAPSANTMTTKREPINMGGSVLDLIMQMSEGNPGAATAIAAILKAEPDTGLMLILGLDDMNMRGPQIWVAYKDHCKQDSAAFIKAIVERDPAMVATVNASRGLAPGTPRAVTSGASW